MPGARSRAMCAAPTLATLLLAGVPSHAARHKDSAAEAVAMRRVPFPMSRPPLQTGVHARLRREGRGAPAHHGATHDHEPHADTSIPDGISDFRAFPAP